jgi:galactoside O-acetyltransferase
MFSTLILEFKIYFENIINSLPGISGVFVRRFYYSKRVKCGDKLCLAQFVEITDATNIQLGNNCSIGRFSALHAHGKGHVRIGDNFSMNFNSLIGASEFGEIIIGDDVIIAQNVVLRASDHEHSDSRKSIRYQGHTGGKIVIKDGVWIGANAVITKNVTVGEHTIIAAGAVVTRDIPDFVVAGGVPAKVLWKRD